MNLHQANHPNLAAKNKYDRLVGLADHKSDLVTVLDLLLNRDSFAQWCADHHGKGLGLRFLVDEASPLVLLTGDVGSGKTALAESVGSAVAERMDRKVTVLSVPSDVRGTGLVGELSLRITEAFRQARAAVAGGIGILIIDEGDDLATSREQLQAHHEDRAGVNVLLKEIDRVGADGLALAVILITNRAEALDPALLRRASLHLRFGRPSAEVLPTLWETILKGVKHTNQDLADLVEICCTRKPSYSHSDLVHRVGQASVLAAYREARALTVEDFRRALALVQPSPEFKVTGL